MEIKVVRGEGATEKMGGREKEEERGRKREELDKVL